MICLPRIDVFVYRLTENILAQAAFFKFSAHFILFFHSNVVIFYGIRIMDGFQLLKNIIAAMPGFRLKWIFAVITFSAALLSPGAAPEPDELNQWLAATTLRQYPNADTVTIYDHERVSYRPDGLNDSHNEFCIKALTETGRDSLRRLDFYFIETYGSVAIESAAIIKPDGRITVVDHAANSSVAIDSGQMNSNIFDPALKVLSLAFPDLETGDAIMVRLNRKNIKTPFPGIFSETFLLQSDSPVLCCEVVIDAPEELPLRSTVIKNPIEGTVNFHGEKRQKGRIIYRWTAENVPQLIPEPSMPGLRGAAQRLLVSTAKDWKEISVWYYELCRPRLAAVDDALREEVEKIISGKRTDEEKAMALFQFVSQKIRYAGVQNEKQAPGFEPHDVKDTFRQRHGVCRDKAALLAVMLDLAGLKAYPALFYAGQPPVDEEAPGSRFNHAVVAWEKAPGKYQLMDPTFETTSEFFPGYLANQSYLVARPGGDVLRRSPSPPAERNLLSIRTTAEFDPKGTLHGESVLSFSGVNDQMYRSAFSRLSPSAMRQIFSRRLHQAIPGVVLEKFTVTPENVRDMSAPLQVTLVYRAEQLLPHRAKVDVLPLPELSRVFGLAPMLLKSADLQKRRHPLLFDTTCAVTEEFNLKLPESVRVTALPPAVNSGDPASAFTWKRELKQHPSYVQGTSGIAINRLEVSPEQYPGLRDAVRDYESRGTALPLVEQNFSAIPVEHLRSAFPDADSFLEYERTAIELMPGGDFEVIRDSRRRILNYAGVKRYSEVKIDYNPQWEQVDIRAVVTAPDGTKSYLEPRDILVMDAPWVAAAPRYPPAKIMVAVLPEVTVGSVVDTVITTRCSGKPFFHFALQLAGRTPVAERELELKMPLRHQLHISPAPVGVTHTVEERGSKQRLRWRKTDQPALPDELQQAPPELFSPGIYLSDGDYGKYARGLNKTLRRLAKGPSEKLDQISRELRSEGKNTENTVLKIRDFVDRKVRAAGPAFNRLPPEMLTPPERTLADGYGNSADRALALAALLARSGIEYRFVAAGQMPFIPESDKLFKSYPAPMFDELLVYIPELDIYLNDTGRYDHPGSTGHAGQTGLDLSSGRLLAIRPQIKLEDEVRTSIRIRLHAGGTADLIIRQTFSGSEFGREKRRFAEMTPELRRQFFERLTAEISPAASLTDAGTFDFSGYPGWISFRCRIEQFAVSAGDHLQFELPYYMSLGRLIGVQDAHRQTPFLRNRAIRRVLEYRIEFPDGFQVVRRRPAKIELGRRNSGYFVEYFAINRNKIVITSTLTLPAELILPQDYVELVHLQRDLNSLSSRRIILATKTKGETR